MRPRQSKLLIIVSGLATLAALVVALGLSRSSRASDVGPTSTAKSDKSRAIPYSEMRVGKRPQIPIDIIEHLKPGERLPEPYLSQNNAVYRGDFDEIKEYGDRNAAEISAAWSKYAQAKAPAALRHHAEVKAGISGAENLGVR